mmetsp:Transcript_25096/g.46528  ORF Transcript_25096/g.46528 Transcript_25096/m.46528 type:complete len:305 (-) Transcript_25096:445-1359(-)
MVLAAATVRQREDPKGRLRGMYAGTYGNAVVVVFGVVVVVAASIARRPARVVVARRLGPRSDGPRRHAPPGIGPVVPSRRLPVPRRVRERRDRREGQRRRSRRRWPRRRAASAAPGRDEPRQDGRVGARHRRLLLLLGRHGARRDVVRRSVPLPPSLRRPRRTRPPPPRPPRPPPLSAPVHDGPPGVRQGLRERGPGRRAPVAIEPGIVLGVRVRRDGTGPAGRAGLEAVRTDRGGVRAGAAVGGIWDVPPPGRRRSRRRPNSGGAAHRGRRGAPDPRRRRGLQPGVADPALDPRGGGGTGRNG